MLATICGGMPARTTNRINSRLNRRGTNLNPDTAAAERLPKHHQPLSAHTHTHSLSETGRSHAQIVVVYIIKRGAAVRVVKPYWLQMPSAHNRLLAHVWDGFTLL